LKLRITIDGKTYEAEVEILEDEESEHPYAPYMPAPVSYTPPPFPVSPASAIDTSSDGGKVCRSPVTGLVIKVNVEPGQTVQPNDVLMVLEAMKMENQVTATHTATVKSVNVVPGNSVKVHQVLLEFE
jgi:methylmalonyl-CoA carboxyltransferase small subunit